MTENLRSPPPVSCERCGLGLPGPDPLTHRTPGKYGRYNPDHPPRSPVRVVKPGPDGELVMSWWCSSKCFKLAHQQPAKKTTKGRPTPDSYFHIRPRAA